MQLDAYAHIVPPRFAARVERLIAERGVPDRIKLFDPWLYEDPVLTDLDARWRLLEPYPDYRQVLVLGVFPVDELGPPELTRDARARRQRRARRPRPRPSRPLRRLRRRSLPLNDPDAALEELERSRRDLGANGVQIHTNVAGLPLDDPRFEPIFARSPRARRGDLAAPDAQPVWPDYPTEDGVPIRDLVVARLALRDRRCAWPGWSTPAISSAIPDLKVVTHHAGGMVPHFSGPAATPIEGRGPARGLRGTRSRRWRPSTTSATSTPTARCSARRTPSAARWSSSAPSHVLFGTDMPLGGPAVIEDTIADLRRLGLAAADEQAVFSGNAQRLLGIS